MAKNVVVVFIFFQSFFSIAQSYYGFQHDNYAGIHSVFNNPSSIVDSRFRTDINIVSVNGTYVNNYYSASFSDLLKNTSDVDSYAEKSPKSDNSFYTNTEIIAPSFMMNITPTKSIALTTRFRGISHMTNLDGRLLQDYVDDGNGDFLVENQNYSLAFNTWAEVGATYAQVLINKEKHFLKGGITLKYIGGISTGYVKAENFSVKFIDENDSNGGEYYTSGIIKTGNIKNFESIDDPFDKRGTGFGTDIGLTYEYRSNQNVMKSNNKYLYKVGFSITDIGFINYKDALQRTFDASTTFSESENNSGDFETYYTLLEENKKITVGLPTAIRTNVDWNIHNKFYLNLNSEISLVKNTKQNSNYLANNLSLTPRLETKWFSTYLPISYVKYSGFQAGFGFRAGPLFIGSGSIISGFLGKTKALDLNFGLKVPVYYNSQK